MRPGHKRPTGSPQRSRAERGPSTTPGARVPFALAVAVVLAGAAPAFAEVSGDPATGGSTDEAIPEPTGGEVETAADGRLTLRASASRVDLGERVTFRGERQPARAGEVVRLRYKGPDDGRYATIATTETSADGRYRVTIKPRRNGVYKAVSPEGSGEKLRSGRESVDVDARVAVSARAHQLNRRGLKVRGQVRPRGAGRRVVIHNLTGKGPERVGTARTERDGSYRLRVSSPDLGRYRLRATFRGDEQNGRDAQRLDHRVIVYRSDHASYYGPGLYGNTTACGQTLRRRTVGVAHKRLPCGTRVTFHYEGRTRTIEVIDRGPYVAGRRWDLTNGARRELRFPRGTDQIWADR